MDECDFLVSDLEKFFHICIKNEINDIQKAYVVDSEKIKKMQEQRNHEIKKMLGDTQDMRSRKEEV